MPPIMLFAATLFASILGVAVVSGVSIDGQSPVEAVVGDEIILTCRGDVESTLLWHHNGMPLEDGTRHSITKEVSDEDSSSQRLVLRVLSVTLMDVGVYSCRNTDDYFDQSSVTIFITEPEPIPVNVEAGVTSVAVDDVISLTCRGDPAALLSWFYNGMPLTANDRIQLLGDAASGLTLTIESASLSDAGRYSCRNSMDIFDQTSVDITVSASAGSREVIIISPDSDTVSVPIAGAFSLRCQGRGLDPLVWSLNGQQLSNSIYSGLLITQATDLVADTTTILLTQLSYDGITAVYRCQDEEDSASMAEITIMPREPFLIDDDDETCPNEDDDDIKIAFSGRSSATYHMSPEYEVVFLDQIHTNLGCALDVNGSAAPATFTALIKGAYTFQAVTNADDNDVVPLVLLHNAQEVMTTGASGHVGTDVVVLTLNPGDVVTLKVVPASPGLLDRLTGMFSSGAPMSRVTFMGHMLYRL